MADGITIERIGQEREKLRRCIRDAEREIGYCKAQLADLDAAERVIKMVGNKLSLDNAAASALSAAAKTAADVQLKAQQMIAGCVVEKPNVRAFDSGVFSLRNPFRLGTIKACIWEVLDQADPPWLAAADIQARASKVKGDEIPMTSISPTLTEMKADFLERDGLLVALKSRLKESGEAEASPENSETETERSFPDA